MLYSTHKTFLSTDTKQSHQRNRGKAATDCELSEPVVLSGTLWKEDSPALKFSGFLAAARAHAHWVVPAPRWNRTTLRGAVVAHSLATGAAVVLGQLGSELALAVVAGQDVLVRHPVGRTSGIFHQTYTGHIQRCKYCFHMYFLQSSKPCRPDIYKERIGNTFIAISLA